MKPSTAATLALLRRHPEGTTSTDAYFEIQTSRLAARVAELRAEGWNIESRMIRTVTGKHVASYVLIEAPEQLRMAV